jgi:hypothetical protein
VHGNGWLRVINGVGRSVPSRVPALSSTLNSNVSQKPAIGSRRQGGLIISFDYITTRTPEPGTIGLLSLGMAGVLVGSFRRKGMTARMSQ